MELNTPDLRALFFLQTPPRKEKKKKCPPAPNKRKQPARQSERIKKRKLYQPDPNNKCRRCRDLQLNTTPCVCSPLEKAVEEIIWSLLDYRGLGTEWENLDPERQNAIRMRWELIIKHAVDS